MNQSGGSSVQTEIFSPENIRFHTKYTKRHTDIMLGCFVVGEDKAFIIETDRIKTISQLRDNIKAYKKNVFKTFDANQITLWKVDIPVTKKQEINTDTNIAQKFGAVELKEDFDTIEEHFGTNPTAKHIHVIVYPPPPATTDQGRTDVSHIIAKFGYLPRQDGRGGTSLIRKEQDAYTAEGISLTDPDTNQRSDLVSSLAKRLEQRMVILFRAPPYSGKTSLAQLLENYLVVNNSSEKLRVIRVSLLWGSSKGTKCEYDTFCEVWKKIVGIGWYEWVEQCNKIQTVLIMDETQRIYESKDKSDESKDKSDESEDKSDVSMRNRGTADEFWDTIKECLQGTNLSIIMFAAYGYGAKSAGLSTPLHIPSTNCMSLTDIRFTDEELKEYVKVYCNRNFGLSRDDLIVSRFTKYINCATAGHVGFIRHILQYTKDEMQSKIRNVELTWKEIYRYLNSSKFNQTIDSCRAAPKLDKYTETQMEICEYVYLNGSIVLLENDNYKNLIKTGIFVVVNESSLCFSAPLVKRSFFQQRYGSETHANSTPRSLYEFIVRTFTIICNESNEILKSSIGTGAGDDKRLLEQTWQKEFYRAGTRALGGSHFLSCDVGPHFESKGYIDFYVKGLEWGIELLREGLDMEEHNRRFESTGEYKEIVEAADETVIIDIRSNSKKVRKLKEGFVHVSYSDNYDAFMIECLGKETIEIIKS